MYLLAKCLILCFETLIISGLETDQETNLCLICPINETNVNTIPFELKKKPYESLFKGKYILDKSNFIERALTFEGLTHVITTPRGFGKSTNLQMLKYFLDIHFNPYGRIVKRENTKQYKLFHQNIIEVNGKDQEIKPPLKISQKQDTLEKYQGKFPVIYLDFSGIGNVSETYEGFVKQISNVIKTTFQMHHNLSKALIALIEETNTTKDVPSELKLEHDWLEHVSDWDMKMTKEEIISSISHLSKIYKEHLGLKSIVLIDNYDFFYSQMLFKFSFPYKENAFSLFANFLSSIFQSGAQFIVKGILTGIMRIPLTNILSGLNNVVYHSLYDDKTISSFYGITENEMNELYEKEKIPAQTKESVTSHFSGYNTISEKKIFNTISIINFMSNNKTIGHYWNDSGNINELLHLCSKRIDFLYYFTELTTGGRVSLIIPNLPSKGIPTSTLEITPEEINTMLEKLNSSNPNISFDTLTKVLLTEGYLTLSQKLKQNIAAVELKCPNREIRQLLSSKILHAFDLNYHHLGTQSSLRAINAFTYFFAFIFNKERESKDLNTALHSYFSEYPSLANNSNLFVGINAEEIIHGFMLSLFLRVQTIPYSSSDYGYPYYIKKYGSTTQEIDATKNPSKLKPDFMLIFKTHIALVELKYNHDKQLDGLFDQEKDYISYFNANNLANIKTFKYLFINVYENTTVGVKGQSVDEETYSRRLRKLKEAEVAQKLK